MLGDAQMSRGVYAYYLWQRAQESAGSQAKNNARNFRKGYAFAKSLPRGFKPARVLELGPGSGWFLRGVRAVFPDAAFFAWDIVPEVGQFMQSEHGFSPLSGSLNSLPADQQFDLVIARDVIEHFADAAAELRQVARLLARGGLFHFITPNGHEDLWKFYVARYRSVEPVRVASSVPGLGFFRQLWYRWKGWHAITLNPRHNFGHEISGLFRKT